MVYRKLRPEPKSKPWHSLQTSIAPPVVSITVTDLGAAAESVQSTVAQVIEQQLNGIDNNSRIRDLAIAVATLLVASQDPGSDNHSGSW